MLAIIIDYNCQKIIIIIRYNRLFTPKLGCGVTFMGFIFQAFTVLVLSYAVKDYAGVSNYHLQGFFFIRIFLVLWFFPFHTNINEWIRNDTNF